MRDLKRILESSYGVTLRAPLQPLPSAVDTNVWRVDAEDRDYILKVFLSGGVDAVQTEVDLLAYLCAAGMGAPDVVPNAHGNRVTAIVERRMPLLRAKRFPAIMMRLEDMRRVQPNSITRAQMLLIARRIGAMHDALRQYPRRAEIRRAERWNAQLGSFEDFAQSPNAEWFAREEVDVLRALDRRMERHIDTARSATLTESVLHGDLGLHHIGMIQSPSGDDVYFFDFSDYCYGAVALDLAALLSHLYAQSEVGFDRWEKLRAWLLEGYEAALPLSDADHAAIDAMLIERLLIEIRYFNRVSSTADVAYDPVGVRKRYQLAAYLLDELSCARTIPAPKTADRTSVPGAMRAEFLLTGE